MKKIKTILLCCVLLGASSCSDFLEEYSQSLAKVEGWQDLDELLLGDAYFQTSRYYIQNYTAYTDGDDNLPLLHFMSDELLQTGSRYADRRNYTSGMFPYYTWQQDTGMDEEGRVVGGDDVYWNDLYKRINTCNMVLALIDEQPELSDEDRINKERVKGEAAFLRAAFYYFLVNLYAQPYDPATAASLPGVPVKLTEYVEDKAFERTPIAEVYKQILADLQTAETCLAGKTQPSIYFADLTAVYLFTSRIYLYMQEWEKAAQYAQKTIDARGSLLDLKSVAIGTNVLSASSPETIFSMGGYMISLAFAEDSWDEPAFYVSDDMVALFGEDDLRTRLFIGETPKNGFGPVFTKISGQKDSFGKYYEVSDCFLLRTAEAYLTLAEASAYANDEATARKTLETFLATRMETPVTVTQSGNDLIDLIRNERARELLLEGHRWFDLRRYTVCKPYPWSKVIEHGQSDVDSAWGLSYMDFYRLEEFDKGYTLPIPREVLEFQVSLGNNERPDRKPVYRVNY